MWEGDHPPLRSTPLHFPLPAAAEAVKALDEEVSSLLAKGAVSVVENPASPGFYGRLFLVPKASGGFRPVLDLSSLNEFLKQEHFKMETPASIRESIRQNDWACKVDLSDAYFHISIAPAHRKFLRFTHRGQVLHFNRLAFGLSLAPWLFTKVVREFAAFLRDKGIRLRAYLDDWAILNQSQALCKSQTAEVVSLAQNLGFSVNWEKSDLVPKQVFDFLGMRFNTPAFVVSPTADRLSKLALHLQSLLRMESASARNLSSLLGSMESLAPLLPLGRLHKRPFQREFRRRWSQALMPWDQLIPLGQWFSDSTEVWRDPSFLSGVVPISPPIPVMTLFSDASTLGWGAHLLSLTASGMWSEEQRSWHINRLELEAVFLALRQFLPTVRGKAVLIATDNTTVSCYIKKQGGARSSSLSQRAEEMLLFCQEHGIVLSSRHIAGKLNVLADALSRSSQVIQTEWTLSHRALSPVWARFHKPLLDLFATKFSKRLPIYVSPVQDPEALAVDALSLDWAGWVAYAFPPLPLLQKVVRKARTDRPCLLLIAPKWPAQPWFPELLELAVEDPLPLSVGPRDLLQPRSGIPHANPGLLRLHAWHLCGGGLCH